MHLTFRSVSSNQPPGSDRLAVLAANTCLRYLRFNVVCVLFQASQLRAELDKASVLREMGAQYGFRIVLSQRYYVGLDTTVSVRVQVT